MLGGTLNLLGGVERVGSEGVGQGVLIVLPIDERVCLRGGSVGDGWEDEGERGGVMRRVLGGGRAVLEGGSFLPNPA